ncbi:MAG: hypothetical protein FWH41_09825 [Treponema sp.]|nr:hypothetical protein [Treponema sp.]
MNKKNYGKIILCCIILLCCAAMPAFSQAEFDLKQLQDTMKDFSGKLAQTMPFNSSMGLYWSDAFIGDFPSFGAGFSFGFSLMDSKTFQKLLDMFTLKLPAFVGGFGGFPIPGYSIEGRLGGYVIPFDVGFKFGVLPIKSKTLKLDYVLIGGDIRFAVLKGKGPAPAISLSMGLNYLSGGLTQNSDQNIQYAYGPNASDYIEVALPKVGIHWGTTTMDFKAQISKRIAIITPYLGFGASTGWSKAGYKVDTKVTDGNGINGNIDTAKEMFKKFGIDNLDLKGFSDEVKLNKWSFRMYGGLSFNIAVVRLDLTAFYNFKDKYGVTFGTRVQFPK